VRYKHLAADDKLIESFHDEPSNPLAAASLLDRSINNTSVVFLLQVGDALLLFPGDAQWGAWRPLLDDADVRSLLTRISVYKVSHHGSHNGTPVEVAHDVFAGVTSLLSVRPIPQWAHIPKPELVADLVRAPRRLVSTVDDEAPDGVTCHPQGLWKEIAVPT
jgi:beta-lactamase superfamily II metal-dependent hydrolase